MKFAITGTITVTIQEVNECWRVYCGGVWKAGPFKQLSEAEQWVCDHGAVLLRIGGLFDDVEVRREE